LCRFVQLELLQGAKNELEWNRLDDYLATQYYLEATEMTWRNAARIYFDLRRLGITVRSPVDCCIACIAMESQALLLHIDRDFEKIAEIIPLENEFFGY
jgi:predicted nucleic acid-binding protein